MIKYADVVNSAISKGACEEVSFKSSFGAKLRKMLHIVARLKFVCVDTGKIRIFYDYILPR